MVRTVLIVDDNPSIRQSLCELFTRQGDFDVCGEAENGREAIDRAQQLHPDLIVMDLSMPVMNSLDAARVLRRLMPQYRSLCSAPTVMRSQRKKPAPQVCPCSFQNLSTCPY